MRLNKHKATAIALVAFLTLGVLAGLAIASEEPSALWLSDVGWAGASGAGFSTSVLLGRDKLPIGVKYTLENPYLIFGKPGESEAEGPWPCTYLGIGWVLRDNLGYSARLLLGPDRGLIGISFRVWNNSQSVPLILTRKPDALPFSCEVTLEDGTVIPRREEHRRLDWNNKKDSVNLVLPPRGKEKVFYSIRDMLPLSFKPQPGARYVVGIYLNALPKEIPASEVGDIDHFIATTPITDASLSIDPLAAIKQTEKLREFLDRPIQGEFDFLGFDRKGYPIRRRKQGSTDRLP